MQFNQELDMRSRQGTGALPDQLKYGQGGQQMAATAETVLDEFAPTNVSTHEPVSNKQIRFTIGSPNFQQLSESVWEFDITNNSNVPVRLDGGACGLIQTLYIYSDQGVELERIEGAGMIATIEKQYTKTEHDLRELEAKEMFCGSLLEKSQRSNGKAVADQRFSPDNYPQLGANIKRTLQVHLPGGWFNPVMGRMLPPESTFQVHIDLAPANECLVYRDTYEVPISSEHGLGIVPVHSTGTHMQSGLVLPNTGSSGILPGDLIRLDFGGQAITARDETGAEIANPETGSYRVHVVVPPKRQALLHTELVADANPTSIALKGDLTEIFFAGDILTVDANTFALKDGGVYDGANTKTTFAISRLSGDQVASAVNAVCTVAGGYPPGYEMVTLYKNDSETGSVELLGVVSGSISLIKIRNGATDVALNYEISNSKMIIPTTRLMDPGLMARLNPQLESLNWMGESYRRHVLALEPAKGEQVFLIPIQARVLKGFSVVFQHTTERTKSYYYTNSQRTLNYVDQYQFTIGGIQHPRQPVVYKAGQQAGVDQSAGRHQDTLSGSVNDMVLSEAWGQASALWGSKGLVTLKDFTGSEDQLGTGVLAINLQTFGETVSERITSGMDLSLTPLPVNLSIRKVKCIPKAIGTGADNIFGANSQTGTVFIFSHVLFAFKKDPVRGLTSRF